MTMKFKKMYNYLFLLLLFPSLCFAETSLWQVSKNGYTLYLGGTIHVLKKDDYPLPVEFYAAFKKADKLVFETDIEKAQTPEFSQKMQSMFTYPAGQSAKDVLRPETLKQLEQHLGERNIPLDSLLRLKPAMIAIVLSVIEYKRMGMTEEGVDQYFDNKAKQAGKAIGELETIDAQLNFLLNMGKGHEDEMIMSTIKDISKLQTLMTVIKAAWLTGDEQAMALATIADMKRDYPQLYHTLLVQRNNNWIPQLERMLDDKPVEMVLVGTLHLVGKDGLLQQLRNKGYTVNKFQH